MVNNNAQNVQSRRGGFLGKDDMEELTVKKGSEMSEILKIES
jgi:hypothetical protein